MYGPASGPFLTTSLADLAGRLANGRPAPAAHPFDPTRGLRPTARPFPPGAARGRVLGQPTATARLAHAVFRWRGGESGTDRPLDRPFVSVQRRTGHRWRTVDTDLGLRLLWRVDDAHPKLDGIPRFRRGRTGAYTATWEPALSAPLGSYRFLITARRYRLASRPFPLRAAASLRATIDRTGRTAIVRLLYPARGSRARLHRPPASRGDRQRDPERGWQAGDRTHPWRRGDRARTGERARGARPRRGSRRLRQPHPPPPLT